MQAASVTHTTARGNAISLTHRAEPGIEPASSWILVRFVTTEPRQKLPTTLFLNPQAGTLAAGRRKDTSRPAESSQALRSSPDSRILLPHSQALARKLLPRHLSALPLDIPSIWHVLLPHPHPLKATPQKGLKPPPTGSPPASPGISQTNLPSPWQWDPSWQGLLSITPNTPEPCTLLSPQQTLDNCPPNKHASSLLSLP